MPPVGVPVCGTHVNYDSSVEACDITLQLVFGEDGRAFHPANSSVRMLEE